MRREALSIGSIVRLFEWQVFNIADPLTRGMRESFSVVTCIRSTAERAVESLSSNENALHWSGRSAL